MLFYQARFDEFIKTFAGTPIEFYNSREAQRLFAQGSLRKTRYRELFMNYVYAYTYIYNDRKTHA